MKGWAVIVGILIFGVIISSGCAQPASSPSTSTTTSIQPTPPVTEQTSQPALQPTVEVTKALEKPLPLTQTYVNDECQFSLKLPDGWVIVGHQLSIGKSYMGIYYEWYAVTSRYYVVTSKFAQENPQIWEDGRSIGRQNATKYQTNAAIVIVPWLADDYQWRDVVNSLRDDPNGKNGKTYDNGTIVEDVNIGNSIKAKKMTLTNTTSCWEPDYTAKTRVCEHSEGEIDYVTVDRTAKGYMLLIEYGVNPQLDGKPIETFSHATYDEIIKSFTIVKT